MTLHTGFLTLSVEVAALAQGSGVRKKFIATERKWRGVLTGLPEVGYLSVVTAIPVSSFWISPDDYLEGEPLAETKHEYVSGQVYAMAGTSRDHNLIAFNSARELGNHLRGKRCVVFANDMKVKIPPEWADAYYYPDVVVSCDPKDNAKYWVERPTLIVEVLSPETRQIDQREKRLAYRAIPSLQLYLLLEQDRVAATVLRRTPEGWMEETLTGPDARLRLDPVELECALGLLYERTALDSTLSADQI